MRDDRPWRAISGVARRIARARRGTRSAAPHRTIRVDLVRRVSAGPCLNVWLASLSAHTAMISPSSPSERPLRAGESQITGAHVRRPIARQQLANLSAAYSARTQRFAALRAAERVRFDAEQQRRAYFGFDALPAQPAMTAARNPQSSASAAARDVLERAV